MCICPNRVLLNRSVWASKFIEHLAFKLREQESKNIPVTNAKIKQAREWNRGRERMDQDIEWIGSDTYQVLASFYLVPILNN